MAPRSEAPRSLVCHLPLLDARPDCRWHCAVREQENTIIDAGSVQVFGSLVNSVIARNHIVRSEGFSILGVRAFLADSVTASSLADPNVSTSDGVPVE